MDNMANYDKMYSLLFNAITDALEKLEKQNLGDAKDILVSAQQKAEEIYITAKTKKAVPLSGERSKPRRQKQQRGG
mgnify:CR=1 FL=1